jgi:hypothetical protein
MMNLLETLDMKILDVYERVNQAAYKNLGWGKYDLVKLVEKGTFLSFGASGLYILASGAHSGRSSDIIFGGINIGLVGLGAVEFYKGATVLATGSHAVPELVENVSAYNQVHGLSSLALSTALVGLASIKYFKDCTMFPPSKSKVTVKSLYDKLKSKVGSYLPAPHPIPVEVKA